MLKLYLIHPIFYVLLLELYRKRDGAELPLLSEINKELKWNIVTCPASTSPYGQKTKSACELVASAAGSNICALTNIEEILDQRWCFKKTQIFSLVKRILLSV